MESNTFFFDIKEGYCEHYAATFVLLARLANIPSRIVTGYYGGELNTVGNFYDFRQKDILNNGQGAPLTPIFHYLLSNIINKKYQTGFPIGFINIGGITNITKVKSISNIASTSTKRRLIECFDKLTLNDDSQINQVKICQENNNNKMEDTNMVEN